MPSPTARSPAAVHAPLWFLRLLTQKGCSAVVRSIRGLTSLGSPLRALTQPGSPLWALTSRGLPHLALAPPRAPLWGLTSLHSPLWALVPSGLPAGMSYRGFFQELAGGLCIRLAIIEGNGELISGEGGIRTPGTLAGTPVFETGPINHSGTSPYNFSLLLTYHPSQWNQDLPFWPAKSQKHSADLNKVRCCWRPPPWRPE